MVKNRQKFTKKWPIVQIWPKNPKTHPKVLQKHKKEVFVEHCRLHRVRLSSYKENKKSFLFPIFESQCKFLFSPKCFFCETPCIILYLTKIPFLLIEVYYYGKLLVSAFLNVIFKCMKIKCKPNRPFYIVSLGNLSRLYLGRKGGGVGGSDLTLL